MLNFLLAIGILFGAFWLLAVLFGPPRATGQASPVSAATPNPDGAASGQTVGLLTGLLGGDIEDAAKAQFALRSLQETTGRAATLYETGLAVSTIVAQAKADHPPQQLP